MGSLTKRFFRLAQLVRIRSVATKTTTSDADALSYCTDIVRYFKFYLYMNIFLLLLIILCGTSSGT